MNRYNLNNFISAQKFSNPVLKIIRPENRPRWKLFIYCVEYDMGILFGIKNLKFTSFLITISSLRSPIRLKHKRNQQQVIKYWNKLFEQLNISQTPWDVLYHVYFWLHATEKQLFLRVRQTDSAWDAYHHAYVKSGNTETLPSSKQILDHDVLQPRLEEILSHLKDQQSSQNGLLDFKEMYGHALNFNAKKSDLFGLKLF